MKSFVYLIVSLGFGALGLAGPPAQAQDDLLWPLPVEPRAITGTFMEFRQGRFHSGMDLRTQGREGLPVRAPAAGSITRLRTSSTGYGVAVYLQLDDGRMLVFGHLSVLSDRLREPILRAWEKTGRYQQYLYLGPGELRVERGELLALSGSTGVGAPHLHLEVRDAQERPMNPQLQGFAVPDTVAPKITEIRVIPLGAGAHVDGERAAKVFPPGASFSAAGTLGVMVRIDDRTGYSPFRVGPLGVVAELDGAEVYRLENETFAFAQTGQMRLEKFVDPENHKKSWLRLYRRPGNELPQRSEFGPPGATFVAREGEEYRLTIRAWDVGGQEGKAMVRVRGNGAAPAKEIPRYAMEGEWIPPSSLEDGICLTGSEFAVQPGWGTGFVLDYAGIVAGVTTYVDDFDWSDLGEALHPGGILSKHPTGVLLGGPETAHDLVGICRVRGEGAVVRNGMSIRVRAHGDRLGELGLFLGDEDGDWSFVAPMSEKQEGTWSGIIYDFGVVALARDTTPPELGAFRVGQRVLDDGETIRPVAREQLEDVTFPDWPAIRIPLKDLAAGIPEDGLTTLLNGEPYPARWEPEDEVLVFEWWLDPGPGDHELTVQARDGLGNASEASIRLSFRR